MHLRLSIALLATPLLASCQPVAGILVAKLVDGQVVIEPRTRDQDQGAAVVMVYNRQGESWAIQATRGPGCEQLPANAPWPLTYGKVPRCFREAAPAPAIRPGLAYRVEASAGNAGIGAFRVTPGGIEQLEPRMSGVKGDEEWPAEVRPDYAPPGSALPPDPLENGG